MTNKEMLKQMAESYLQEIADRTGKPVHSDFKEIVGNAYMTGVVDGIFSKGPFSINEVHEIKKSMDFEKSYKQWKGREWDDQ